MKPRICRKGTELQLFEKFTPFGEDIEPIRKLSIRKKVAQKLININQRRNSEYKQGGFLKFNACKLLSLVKIDKLEEKHTEQSEISSSLLSEDGSYVEEQNLLDPTPDYVHLTKYVKTYDRTKVNKSKKIKLNGLSISEKLEDLKFGSIWKVNHSKIGQALHLRAISKTEIKNSEQITMILTMKDVLYQLKSSNWIAQFHETLQDEGHIYFVQNFEENKNLQWMNRLDYQDPSYSEMKLEIISELFCALEDFHSLGVVYRNIRLSSILIDSIGHIKLSGLSKAKKIGCDRTYTRLGRIDFNPPEILLG